MVVLIGLALVMLVLYSWLRSSARGREAPNDGDRDIVWRGGRRQLTEDAARRMVEGPLQRNDDDD